MIVPPKGQSPGLCQALPMLFHFGHPPSILKPDHSHDCTLDRCFRKFSTQCGHAAGAKPPHLLQSSAVCLRLVLDCSSHGKHYRESCWGHPSFGKLEYLLRCPCQAILGLLIGCYPPGFFGGTCKSIYPIKGSNASLLPSVAKQS